MCGQIGVNVSAIVVIMRQQECWVARQTSNRVPAPGAEHPPLHADFMSIMQLHSTGGMLVRARACCPSIRAL